jgi:hypothetical protein
VSKSDGREIGDNSGTLVLTQSASGLDRAQVRLRDLDRRNINWQIELIRQNTAAVSLSAQTAAEISPRLRLESDVTPVRENFLAEADRIATELSDLAVRRGSSAAWIGMDSLVAARATWRRSL